MSNIVIAIDGPAGSGKSTTAKLVAEKLGLLYLDTGAMYRAIALKATRLGYEPNDGGKIARMAERTTLEFVLKDGKQLLLMDGEDVSSQIRTPDVTSASSLISAFPQVREVMVRRQRKIGAEGGVVAEGRDTASVVFPEADVKVYLDANHQTRAQRRLADMTELGVETTLKEQIQRLSERDLADSTRDASPLKKVPDAICVDTTELTIEQQVERIVALANEVASA